MEHVGYTSISAYWKESVNKIEKSEDSAGELADKTEVSIPLSCLGMVKHHKKLLSQRRECAVLNNPQGWTQAKLGSATEPAHPGELLQVRSQGVFLLLE